MRVIITVCVSVSVIWAQSTPLGAWGHANRFGGGTAHAFGATAHMNRFGGSWAHMRGVGTTGTTRYGGTATHAWGGGGDGYDALWRHGHALRRRGLDRDRP
jgi:hypothetical protein